MKRFEYRQQVHGGNRSRSHALPAPSGPVSFPAALSLVTIQLSMPSVVDALCHIVTDYGHGVCTFREVLAATSDAYQVPPKPAPPYFCQPVTAVVRDGLLSPGNGTNEATNSDNGSAWGDECAFVADKDTMIRARNPFKSPFSDLASGRVAHTGEHPFLIIVPRGSYKALYQGMQTPQRVWPWFNNGRLELEGITLDYNPSAYDSLSLDDLLDRGGPG